MREARRPFSSFIRRLFQGPEEEEFTPAPLPEKPVQPDPDEYEDEFWDPRAGAPPAPPVQPMRPEQPRWKKDIPGLTDPFLEEREWQDEWLTGRQEPKSSRPDPAHLPPSSSEIEDAAARKEQFSTFQIQRNRQQTLQHPATSSASIRSSEAPETIPVMEEQAQRQENLDAVVDRLLRDKDFLLAEELKHKAEEINQLLVQAQRQKMKVELTVSELESRPGNKVSWVDVKIFKEI